jgi:hypothetical protein
VAKAFGVPPAEVQSVGRPFAASGASQAPACEAWSLRRIPRADGAGTPRHPSRSLAGYWRHFLIGPVTGNRTDSPGRGARWASPSASW